MIPVAVMGDNSFPFVVQRMLTIDCRDMLLIRSKSGGGSGVGEGVEVTVLLAIGGVIGRGFLVEVDCFILVLVAMVIVVVACVVLATRGEVSVLVATGCICLIGCGA
ncbi:MAG: hypothetical protein QG579_450 [Patescibacteria group bacterium]|nr:hypothetical protein [Patescibacteria group bacterium]